MPEMPMKSTVLGVLNSRPQFAPIGEIELRTPIGGQRRRPFPATMASIGGGAGKMAWPTLG